MNTDPGVSGIGYDQQATTHGNSYMIGSAAGASNLRIRKRYAIKEILGDRLAETDTNFIGTSGANPADLTYVGLGFRSLANLTNGVYLTVSIQFVAEFFDSKRTTPGALTPPVSSQELDAAVQRLMRARATDKVPAPEDIQTIKKHQQFRKDWEEQLSNQKQKTKDLQATESLVV